VAGIQGTEQRLAAVLVADVVGYSRLMAEDQDSTVRTVTAYREEVELHVRQHRGRLVDFTGDEFLAEFPTALESVRCAVEIQKVLEARNSELPSERRMLFRMGIHLGDVAAQGERLYGDGVNIAARLQALADPGGVCVSGHVHDLVHTKLGVGFDDLGTKSVKNIPAPVRVYRVQPGDPKAVTPTGIGWRRLRRAVAAGLAAIVLLGAGIWLSWPRPLGWALDVAGFGALPQDPPLPDMPSVVVLPFLNLSDDPEQGYLADGIAEDLTASLAGNPWIFVISRSSAFTYRGAVNLAELSRELGVRYVVEGSVRKVAERVRVTAQLIDATRDVHVWSERYDRDLTDLLDLQSEISEQILGAVGVEIRQAEMARLRHKPTDSFSAYEAFMRGLGHLREMTAEGLASSRPYFERALEADPEYARAYAYLAWSYSLEALVACPNDLDELTPQILELAGRAVELDPLDPVSHLTLALTRERPAESVLAAERAVELAPSFDLAHFILGMVLLYQGRPLEAIGPYRRALRLSPRPPAQFLGLLGHANYLAGRPERAVDFYERARAANPDVYGARVMLAAHYEGSGQHEKARSVVDELLLRHPECSAEWASRHMRLTPGAVPELRDWLIRAGLPEG
jgi:TolB-like protein/class 3 adenylate cyclase/Tfp pilus assembly protein PilF